MAAHPQMNAVMNGMCHKSIPDFNASVHKAFPDANKHELDAILRDFKYDARSVRDDVFKPLFSARSALIVVDFQNDFIDGSLAVGAGPAGQDPLECVDAINEIVEAQPFHLVVYTKDWHPESHISFLDNVDKYELTKTSSSPALFEKVSFADPDMDQVLYPVHCVRDTPGADLHSRLKIPENAVFIEKGVDATVEQYSAFLCTRRKVKTQLDSVLKRHHIQEVYVCGLAYDICVAETALDALTLGYRTAVLENCSKGLDQANIDSKKRQLTRDGAAIIHSRQIGAILKKQTLPWAWVKFQANRIK